MRVVDTGKASAAENMALDEQFLKQAEPLIHFYDWEREAATYGHFTDPSELLLPDHGLDLAKRPTGGGIIFHTNDLAFSILMTACSTNTLDNYHAINRRIAQAIEAFTEGRVVPNFYTEQKVERPTFCMKAPTIYDLVVANKKVAGAAQRRTKYGLLHQGSICLHAPGPLPLRDKALAAAIQKNSYPIAPDLPLELAREKLKLKIVEFFL